MLRECDLRLSEFRRTTGFIEHRYQVSQAEPQPVAGEITIGPETRGKLRCHVNSPLPRVIALRAIPLPYASHALLMSLGPCDAELGF